MHDGGWEALLKHIPAEQHSKYTVVTANGTEIAIHSLLRIERELVVLKGRLSGSQDQGRVFFIPYKNIDSFGTAQMIKDVEFAALFDSFTFPAPQAPVSVPASAEEPPEPEPAPESEPATATVNGNGQATGTGNGAQRIRSAVLERFRNARANGPSSSGNLSRPPAES